MNCLVCGDRATHAVVLMNGREPIFVCAETAERWQVAYLIRAITVLETPEEATGGVTSVPLSSGVSTTALTHIQPSKDGVIA